MFEQKPMLLSKDFKAASKEVETTVSQEECVVIEEPDYVDFLIYDGNYGKFTARWHSERENMLEPGYYYAMLLQQGSGMGLVQLLDATSENEAYKHATFTARELNVPVSAIDVFYCIEAGVKDAVVLWGSPYTERPSAVTFEKNGNVIIKSIH